jgi:putative Holliday junction resolvase
MPRIIAIDYGRKRSGIAVTDPLKIIAHGLTTVASDTLVGFLKDYFQREEVDMILVGYPTNLDGSPTDITAKVEKISGQFQKLFPDKEIKLIDERYTSKMATQAIRDSGLNRKGRQNKALVDEVSATILLQGYLQ